jgi:hypothetical protein
MRFIPVVRAAFLIQFGFSSRMGVEVDSIKSGNACKGIPLLDEMGLNSNLSPAERFPKFLKFH